MSIIIDSFSRNGVHGFLSNFYLAPVWFEGYCYSSNEHAFVAAKTQDEELRTHIREAKTPGEAKRIGRRITLRDGWDQYIRYGVMEYLLGAKFSSGSSLGNLLLDTGPAILIEGNSWHDQTWGDCRCGRPECAAPGMNLLGWMLMRQRFQLSTHRR
jgi:ribA/ribD-fused uncharacterized protein